MISIIVATHNGASTLPLTLEALKAVRPPAAGLEIIAVDNASSDCTAALLAQYREVLPLTVLSEPRRGKSFALNRALATARGEFILFTDDDVLPDPHWLEAFEQAATRFAEADLFAGQVRHHWQKEPPTWLRRLAEEGRSYGGTPVGQPEGPVGVDFFKGANFMVRRGVIGSVAFSERPGLVYDGTAAAAGGEDSAFVRDALAKGHRSHYVPGACVRHIVRPHQVGLLPVLRRYLRIGRAMALSNADPVVPTGAQLFGFPRYVFKTVPHGVLRALRHWLGGDSYAAADDLITVAMTCGWAQQWRKLRGANS